ncbi:DUF6349 family protein [Williamsia sp.]|uniref:DUF6349 family protein n=1 Tax=Williamsia sp. TaxID=1872085 RepID=UPI001A2CAB5F|nr:DUF6349 family protein [Williamsia sp.]MBJ7287579.1 hypothetical protein [Williamsia sp.]
MGNVAAQLDQFALFDIESDADRILRKREDHIARYGIPSAFNTPARGLMARLEVLDAWKQAWGNFDCIRVSHTWHPGIMDPFDPSDTCQPAYMSANLYCHHHRDPNCQCVNLRLNRAMCRGCDWEADTDYLNSDHAIADAHDHAFPGWRESPLVLDPQPMNPKPLAKWQAKVIDLYGGDRPNGWPIISPRPGGGNRSVPCRSPFGGYDMAQPIVLATAP